MKLLKSSLFVCFLSLSNAVFAAPATGIGGAENLSNVCPAQPAATCPPGVQCESCPTCSSPPVCEVCHNDNKEESQCKSYRVDFLTKATNKSTKVQIDQSDAKGLGCFADIVNQALNSIRKDMDWHLADWGKYSSSTKFNKSTGSNGHVYGGVLTSMIWEHLKAANGLAGAVNFSNHSAAKLFADNEKAKEAISCTGDYKGVIPTHGMWQFGGSFSGAWNKLADGCTAGSLYLDKNCKFVNADDVNKKNLCGSIDYYAEIATPISLVWNKEFDTKASTLVNFKLNPFSDNNTWLWRGSESLPLLVYDPEHKGVINSATQLFGSWTFGGNGLVSLIEGNSKGTPWRDGYEALSKMDKNLDGEVSGAEIKDLALWFDNNQDGISQDGEVKALFEVSVTTLYYNADQKEKGALIATKGYEREFEGKKEILASMDWYEKSVSGGFDIILDSLKVSSKTVATDLDQSSDIAKDQSASEILGAWGWKLDHPAQGSGIFTFAPTEEGILGSTVSQLGMLGNPNVANQIIFSHFKVDEVKNTEGKSGIKFIVDRGNGAILTNTASLSEDGSSLIGKTVVTGSSLSESGTYEYAWKAERIE